MECFKGRVPTIVIAAILASGCAAAGDHRNVRTSLAADIAPDNCIEKNKNDVNYVKIAYKADGYPFADPDECHVRPGSTVIWLLPDKVGNDFKILFDKDGGRTPDLDGTKEFVGKRPSTGDHKAVLPVIKSSPSGAEPKYRYSIDSNGKTSDPSIIIDM
jgi:hypothetical protein